MALGVSNALRRVSSTSSRSIPSCGMAATEVPKKIHATDRVGGIMKQHEAATCSAVVDAACLELGLEDIGHMTVAEKASRCWALLHGTAVPGPRIALGTRVEEV